MPHDAHDPALWLSYDEAARIVATWGPDHFGVGFVLTADDPFGVIDIDNCLDPLRPSGWSELTETIVAAMPGAVVEVSQSGRGLHVWFRTSAMPDHAKRKAALGIECYFAKRYIMLGTGQTGTLADDCPGIVDVVVRYFPPDLATPFEIPEQGPCAEWSGPVDDDQLIELARTYPAKVNPFDPTDVRAAFADLFDANVSILSRVYRSPKGDEFNRSDADFALMSHFAFLTGRDVTRTNRLMRRSKLARDKWDRPDGYFIAEIRKACASKKDVLKLGGTPPAPIATIDPHAPRDYGILPDDPLSTAKNLVKLRHDHADGPCLKSWQGSFYQWGASRWQERHPDDMRASLYDFLDRYGESYYRPTQTKVNALLDALKASTHLDSTLMPPCWIKGAPLAPAAELVACANGMLHLPTRSLIAPTPRFFNLNAVPFDYAPDAALPEQWLQFLATIWPDDPEAIETLQEVFGYLLTPDTSQQKIFLMIGPKRSGKGTIARVLTEMLGPANVAGPTLASMATPFGLQPLIGTLAAIVSDARLSGRTDQKEVAENLLRISGEDRIEIGRKFLPSLTLKLGTRFVLLTNELPRIADASGAMASRFVILTMRESFLGREDPGLTSRLLGELPGVLSWAIEGWHRLRARGHFVEPRSSAGAAQELADLGSPIGAFVREHCECQPHAETEMGALFVEWRDWCVRQGISHPGSAQTFGRDLRAAFPSITQGQKRISSDRVRVYRGIRLARSGTRSNPSQSASGT